MRLRQLRSRVRLFKGNLDDVQPAKALPLDRDLTSDERAIAEWLLLNADPPATAFLHQLDSARVTGQCSCGCPTVDLLIGPDTPRAEPRDNLVGDVMLLQSQGCLTCLEVYDLSDIEHPYGLPGLSSLKPFHG